MLKDLAARLLSAAQANPVRVATYTAAVIVFVAAKAGVVISEQDVLPALLLILPIVLGGEAARRKVSPV